MADDLRKRIRRGDLAALTDPALPLHLLAEPGARWWNLGAFLAAREILRRCADAAEDREACVAVLVAWRREVCEQHGLSTGTFESLDEFITPTCSLGTELERVAVVVLFAIEKHGADNAAALNLARRLRALLPSAPPGVDEALAILERYAG